MTDATNDKIPAERPAGMPKKEKVSSLPVPLDSKHPGKTRWRIWSTEFEIDDRYVPIKVRQIRIFFNQRLWELWYGKGAGIY